MPVDARYSRTDEFAKPDSDGWILVVAVPRIAERDLSVTAGSGDLFDDICMAIVYRATIRCASNRYRLVAGQGLCNLLVEVVPRQPDILWIDHRTSVSGEGFHRVLRVTALAYAIVQRISKTPPRSFQLRISVLQNSRP